MPGQPGTWPELHRLPRLPLPLLLCAVAALAFWPQGAYWQSDDFLALAYADSLGGALSDFVGNQYGLTGVTWFYRPLVTLSFWFDGLFGDLAPTVAHCGNALAHGLCALVLARIALRWTSGTTAWAGALLWALMPSHHGAVAWAVGRVDVYATLFTGLALLAALRWREGRAGLAPALLAGLLALASKESALMLPALAFVLGYCRERDARPVEGVQLAMPFVILVTVAMILRGFALGFGHLLLGYDVTPPSLGSNLEGFWRSAGQLASPTLYAGTATLERIPAWVGVLPVLGGLAVAAMAGRWRLVLTALALAALAALPFARFVQPVEHPKDLRWFYCAAAPLCFAIAAGGRVFALASLVAWLPAFLDLREDFQQVWRENRKLHGLVLEADGLSSGPRLFVAGLPNENAAATAIAFHVGVDRLLRPPFADSDTQLLALRPIGGPGIGYGDERGLPIGTSFAVDRAGISALLPPASLPKRAFALEGRTVLDPAGVQALRDGRADLRLSFPEGAASHYRVTLFTAMGYSSLTLPAAADGALDLWSFLRAPPTPEVLLIASALDLRPVFPLLVEGGSPGPSGSFRSDWVAESFVDLECDRSLPEYLRGRITLPSREN